MSRDRITLFLTEARAFEAAQRAVEDLFKDTGITASLRVLSATMRDHDGTVDHGFKVLITQRGKHRYFL